MAQSPAYEALSPSGRRVLALIDSKVTHGGGVAAISFSDIERQCGMIHGTCGFALRQVRLLGFVSVERGPGPRRRMNTFRFSRMSGVILMPPRAGSWRRKHVWASLQTPSLPRMPWDDAR